MTDAEAAQFDKRTRAAMSELVAIEQELERHGALILALKSGPEHAEERQVKRVCPVQRIPLSPVKDNLI